MGIPIERILVTGCCGFIGANFVRHELATDPADRDHQPRRARPTPATPTTWPIWTDDPRYHFVRGDIADRAMVMRLVAEGGFDAVVNFAAESHVDRSIDDATPFLRTNVVGTQCLLDAARAAKVPRYVQVSTDEVYGTLAPTTRRSPRRPRWPPTARTPPARPAADLLVRAAHHTYGMDTVITRCSNNYGPYQFPEKLIPLFITNLLADIPVPVYGDGRQVRDWIHVTDHCRGIDAALRRGRPGEVYNFGGRSERYNIDVTHAHPGALRQGRRPDPPRHRPPRPRPPIRGRLREGRGRAGLAADRHLRAGARRDRPLVSRQRPLGGPREVGRVSSTVLESWSSSPWCDVAGGTQGVFVQETTPCLGL